MIYTLIDLYTEDKKYNNVSLGKFDGVHLGHQYLLRKIPKEDSLVIVFNSEGDNILTPFEKIYELGQILPKTVDILIIDLTGSFKLVSASKFNKFLQKLSIKNIFVGEDFKFGYKQRGNIDYLKKKFNVEVTNFLKIEQMKISSSSIKEELKLGKLEKVNFMLGKQYYVSGEVIHGKELGREIGFPTLNLKKNKLLPKNGVYKTKVLFNDTMYKSITNVGIKPTTNGEEILIETHIIDDFNLQIYGEEIIVFFDCFIREEQKFNSLESLKEQIKKDVNIVKEMI